MYSRITLANLTRLADRRRFTSSTCMRTLSGSTMTFPLESPMVTSEGASQHLGRAKFPGSGRPAVDRHSERVRGELRALRGVDAHPTTRRLNTSSRTQQ